MTEWQPSLNQPDADAVAEAIGGTATAPDPADPEKWQRVAIPVRLGAQWVELHAAKAKLDVLVAGHNDHGGDHVAYMRAELAATAGVYEAMDALRGTLNRLDNNLGAAIAACEAIGTEAAPL